MKHLTNLEIQGFVKRNLELDALLEFDDHLAACSECREALERVGVVYSDPQLASIFAIPEPHLTYEELTALVGDKAVAPWVTAHAASCNDCAREAAELRAFASELEANPRVEVQEISTSGSKLRRWRINPVWYALAASILVAVIAGAYWRNSLHPASEANIVASLWDGNAQLALDGNGQLRGANDLTAQQRDMLRSALMSGKVQAVLPPEFTGQKTETMLGAPLTGASFKVLSPVSLVSIDDRPTFRWEALNGATGYRVVIYGEGYQKVAESPILNETAWQTPVALPRGAVYTWSVTANLPHGTVHSPAPPQPEAIFKVISAEEATELQASAQEHAGDPLLLAALYARAGAIVEAQAQIDKLAGENPNNALVAQLKASLAESQTAQAPSPIKTNAAQ